MNRLWLLAAFINLVASVMHLIMGYYDPLLPLQSSGMKSESIDTLNAVWYMATLVMFGSSFLLLHFGVKPKSRASFEIVRLLGVLYVLFALIFIFFSLPQWFVLLPIGLLALYGTKASIK